MLQYLIIVLDDTSTSYCHYDNLCIEPRLMPLDVLKEGIVFGMKENLRIQFVYPDYDLPTAYKEQIETIDHSKIMTPSFADDADVIVFSDLHALVNDSFDYSKSIVLRASKSLVFSQKQLIESVIGKVSRLNLVITDFDSFVDEDYKQYKKVLDTWSKKMLDLYIRGERPQFNVLTDRIMLNSMNNCGAGDTSITLAPDGRFYICPAFYHIGPDDEYGLGKSMFNVGSLQSGLMIRNANLYKLPFAPICAICDAYQCKRCVWLNRKLTNELNTPSRQQCVISHIERNASACLLDEIKKCTGLFDAVSIKKIDYLDPFEKIINNS